MLCLIMKKRNSFHTKQNEIVLRCLAISVKYGFGND